MKSYRSYITALTTMVLLVGAVFATSGQDGRKSVLDAKYNVDAPKGIYEARVKHHAQSIQEERIKHNINEPLSISDVEPSTDNGPTRSCDDCEFDWTDYGAECCDAAWDDFGVSCADLTANYGWDCAGCLCPGDVPCEDQGLVTCDFDGSCAASTADCPGSCEDTGDFVDDCSGDGDCCPLSWIGDGFEDCEDQQYGCDLTCYDDDGGDCGPVVSCEDQGLFTCPNGSCAATEADCPEPSDCEFDWTAYGAADCDAAWDDFGINCADLEANYGWDCAGCNCPGDTGGGTGGTGGGECDPNTEVEDCADDDCCPMSWIGDGFEDCEDQAYGCDLTCYDDDGGDCAPVVSCEDQGMVTCPDGSCAANEADCPEPSEGCTSCEFDWTNYGSECCDTAWDEFGINCSDLEANYGWDCAGCACPGDLPPECGDGSCNGDETFATCPEDCSESGCDDNTEVVDCSGDGDCCPLSWIGDGFEDCEDQAWGCDLTCYDMDGGDCGPVVTCEDQGLVTCWDGSCAASEADCPELGDQLIDCEGNVWDNLNVQYAGDGDSDGDGCMDTVYDCVIDNGTCEDVAGECLDASGACTGVFDCPDGEIGAWTNDTLCDDGDFGLWANCEELCFDGGACGTMPDDDCTIGDGSNCESAGTGDVNFDGASNVLDIVQIVNYILGSVEFDDCQLESADLNGDGAANVLDIVAIVNVILDGRTIDATKAGLIKAGNALNLNADGFIGGVQMTLSHGADFSIELTDKAMVADYRTEGNETTLIIVAPEGDELFIATGKYDIVDMIVANSAGQMDVSVVPNSFVLSEAYPNPFNPSTTINLSIPEAGNVSVMVYNVMGQLVSTLADGHMNASDYSFTWDASSVPSGVYLITATTANHTDTQKVMLLK